MAARHAMRPDEPLEPGTAIADVHAHTRRSDGVLEPAELVRQAHAAGIRLFAIADHDTLAAYRELTAPGADPLPDGLELVPAVEINAVTRGLGLDLPEGELHVLGIGVDPADDAFEAAVATQRDARRARFAATVQRLREIGTPGRRPPAPGRPRERRRARPPDARPGARGGRFRGQRGGRLPADPGTRQAGLRAADRDGAGGRDPRRSGRPGASRRWRTSPRPRSGSR